MRVQWWAWMKHCCAPSKYVLSPRGHRGCDRISIFIFIILDPEACRKEGQVSLWWYEYGTTRNATSQAQEGWETRRVEGNEMKWEKKARVVGKIIFQTTLGGTYAVWLEGGGGIWCLIEKTATYKNNISL